MEDQERQVIIAALAHYLIKGCPLGEGATRDDEYRKLGFPLRRATPPEIRQRWKNMVAQVHESLISKAVAN